MTKAFLLLLVGAGVAGLLLPEGRAAVAQAEFGAHGGGVEGGWEYPMICVPRSLIVDLSAGMERQLTWVMPAGEADGCYEKSSLLIVRRDGA